MDGVHTIPAASDSTAKWRETVARIASPNQYDISQEPRAPTPLWSTTPPPEPADPTASRIRRHPDIEVSIRNHPMAPRRVAWNRDMLAYLDIEVSAVGVRWDEPDGARQLLTSLSLTPGRRTPVRARSASASITAGVSVSISLLQRTILQAGSDALCTDLPAEPLRYETSTVSR